MHVEQLLLALLTIRIVRGQLAVLLRRPIPIVLRNYTARMRKEYELWVLVWVVRGSYHGWSVRVWPAGHVGDRTHTSTRTCDSGTILRVLQLQV